MKYVIIFTLAFLAAAGISMAQSQESGESTVPPSQRNYDRGATYGQRSAKGKKEKKSVLGIFRKKKQSPYNFDEKIKEYEKRMETNAKKRKKMEKEMEKPQYSDPTYFGHKKPPKKRKPGKKKFCKECGMRH